MALMLKHQTLTDFMVRFREAYRNASQDYLVMLARFILARVQAADITDAQCRSAFGLNTTQWNTLKTKMQSFVTASNTVQGAVGE